LFLELEPQVRDIIFKFYESKYASCLKMLDEMKVRGNSMAVLRQGRQGRQGFCLRRVPTSSFLPGQSALGYVPRTPC
jgi:hypothetical protein